jgi:hypothetical protein
MHEITAIYGAILFVLLPPGLIVRIPSKGPLLHATIVHGILFAILYYFISKIVLHYSNNYTSEHFSETYSGDAHCMKCKSKQQCKGIVIIKNKRRMAKGKCSKCNSNVVKFLPKIVIIKD